MNKLYISLINIIIFSFISTHALSSELAGLWQEYNDDTGNLEALIRIKKMPDNSYEGRIEKTFPAALQDTLCKSCSGSLHNQPLMGLRILYGLKRKDGRSFEDGEITDPDDGKNYRCNIRFLDDGNTIEVTGYLGFNWIGHSEIWRRNK